MMKQPVRYFFATPVRMAEVAQTDEIMFTIQNKLLTVQKLQDFEQDKQAELTIVQ